MGAPKQKWTAEEEQALRAGVVKHGSGKWRTIQKDPEFSQYLASRSNIDLKDKWRNMSVSASGQGSREKSKASKLKAVTPAPISGAESLASAGHAALPAPVKQESQTSHPSADMDSAKVSAKYDSMIFNAMAALHNANGSEIGTIFNYIEKKHEVPSKFRKLLGSRLRCLHSQGKIERVDKAYKLKESSIAIETSNVKTKEPGNQPMPLHKPGTSTMNESLAEAVEATVYKIAEAEAKSFLAAEAVKEAERISRMAEEAEMMLQLAMEIMDQCSRGEMVMLKA